MEADWGSLIPVLLTLVVHKVQEGAGSRGEGRRLVAFAGVCRAWRRSVLEELRRRPPFLFTFPASIWQPASSGPLLQCLLKKTGHTFRLVQVVSGHEYFLLGARKSKYSISSSCFRISTDPRELWTQGNDDAISSVASNFWRTAFSLQENSCAKSVKPNPNTTLLLKYEEVAVDGNCMRRMRCTKLAPADSNVKSEAGWWSSWFTTVLKKNLVLDFFNPVNLSYKSSKNSIALSSPQSIDTVTKSRSSALNEGALSLRNKDPDWHEQEQCWSLDFKGRGSIVASIHNFQLVSDDDSSDGRVILQLGKICKGLFILDFGAPLSVLEAFAISLSSFATSVGLDTS